MSEQQKRKKNWEANRKRQLKSLFKLVYGFICEIRHFNNPCIERNSTHK